MCSSGVELRAGQGLCDQMYLGTRGGRAGEDSGLREARMSLQRPVCWIWKPVFTCVLGPDGGEF